MDQQVDPHTRARNNVKGSGLITSDDPKVAEEERKIRDKLEEEVERGLEDEIKDGIYHLALRLRRLYESQKERTTKSKQGENAHTRVKSPSEVNISIKMDGGTKVKIREAKKGAHGDEIRKGSPQRLASARRSTGEGAKRLEWAKSLRSTRAVSVPPRSPNVVKKREPFRFGL